MNKILLDVCCAPCAVPAMELLIRKYPEAELVLYSNNSNIHPKEEYENRLKNIKRIAAHFGKEIIVDDYNPEEWLALTKGLENEPENGKRCIICYEFRLAKAAEYAAKNGFDAFASTLTTGPPKKAAVINAIGQKIARKSEISFLAEDFKKSNGYLRSTIVSKELNLYRQNYCGCCYSIRKEQ
jgi:predicted adenine nucleotide alpha hydrolase (AANH) superfamily ATPase